MISRKGQALVEFVLILPIIIMILCIIIDFSTVFYKKNHLEGVLNDTVSYVSSKKEVSDLSGFLRDDKITGSIKRDNLYITITLKENVTLITPFANLFFDNPYTISTKRMILNE